MKKIIFISLIGLYAFANPCKDLPKEERKVCHENKKNNQEGKMNQIRQIESESHQGRISILTAADNCIKQATTKEQYKECENIEKNNRKNLKEKIITEKRSVRNN